MDTFEKRKDRRRWPQWEAGCGKLEEGEAIVITASGGGTMWFEGLRPPAPARPRNYDAKALAHFSEFQARDISEKWVGAEATKPSPASSGLAARNRLK